MNALKKYFPFLGFIFLYIIFLHPLLLGQSAFLHGDYGQQFYPWSYLYDRGLDQGVIPLWSDLIQMGTEIFAEGQAAMLYVLNLMLYHFLPFDMAYNLVFLSHFLLGGLFMYIYLRVWRVQVFSAVIGAMSFTFGSAYAGCFYNIVSMRSLIWFPLMLYAVHKILLYEKVNSKHLLAFALLLFSFSQSLLAGFPQTAIYALGFTWIYFFIFLNKNHWVLPTVSLILATLFAFIWALPQWWATLELALHSTRAGHDSDFILWGSVSPASFLTLVMPYLNMLTRAQIYIGLLPFVIVLAFPAWRRHWKIWILLMISLLLALGRFNPMYLLFMELPGASLLRNPSKFLFFTTFFLIMISVFALDKNYISHIATEHRLKLQRTIVVVLLCLMLVYILLVTLLDIGSPVLRHWGYWYVDHFVANKSFHRGDIQTYYTRIDQLISMLKNALKFNHIGVWRPFVLLILFYMFIKNPLCMKTRIRQWVFMCFLIADLLVFSYTSEGTGFLGNIKTQESIQKTTIPVATDHDGRWINTVWADPLNLKPSKNILSDKGTPAAYSPMIDRNYYEVFKDWGILDDSFGYASPTAAQIFLQPELLNDMGIQYAVVEKNMRIPHGWRLFMKKKTYNILFNAYAKPLYTYSVEDNSSITRLSVSADDEHHFELNAMSPNELIIGRRYNRHWKAYLNHENVSIQKHRDIFQKVNIPKGKHHLKLQFEPSYFSIGMYFYYIGFGVWILITGLALIVRKKHGE